MDQKYIEESITIAVHDIKNPIATIRLSAGIMAKMAKNDIATRQANAILNSSYLLERQVNMYGDLLRLETKGSIPLNLEMFDQTIVYQLFDHLSKPLIEEEYEAIFDEQETTSSIQCDKGRLFTAMDLLLQVSQHIKLPKTKLKVLASFTDEHLEISILFELSKQKSTQCNDLFEQSFTPNHKNDGFSSSMELYLANSIVKAHHGNLYFHEGILNRGFIVQIPLQATDID